MKTFNKSMIFVMGFCAFWCFGSAAFCEDIPLEKTSAAYGNYELAYVINLKLEPYQLVSAEDKADIAQTLGKVSLTPTAILFDLPASQPQPCKNITLYKMHLMNQVKLEKMIVSSLTSLGIKVDPATIVAITPNSMIGKYDYNSTCQVGFIWVNNQYLLLFNPRADFLMIYNKK